MIKGCAKRVVVVRDIESNFFEEAFFIVKQGSSKRVRSENDYLNEANRIVKSDLPTTANAMGSVAVLAERNASLQRGTKRKRQRLRDAFMFIAGFGMSAVLCSVIYYSGILL